ncbi:MAG: hypothetical protein ACE5KK_06590, partial [Candidatus Brocadiales bacterium]
KLAFGGLGSKTLVFTTVALLFYLFLIKIAVWAVAAAFAGSAQSVLYLLMRKDVDGTEVEDVYTEEVETALTTPPPAPESPPAGEPEEPAAEGEAPA